MSRSGADQELVWPLCIDISGFALCEILHKIALLGSEQSAANIEVQND